jgi:hypothetical protein
MCRYVEPDPVRNWTCLGLLIFESFEKKSGIGCFKMWRTGRATRYSEDSRKQNKSLNWNGRFFKFLKIKQNKIGTWKF